MAEEAFLILGAGGWFGNLDRVQLLGRSELIGDLISIHAARIRISLITLVFLALRFLLGERPVTRSVLTIPIAPSISHQLEPTFELLFQTPKQISSFTLGLIAIG